MYGFAMFAMFFGSGNLVFPLQIGQATGNNWLMGFFGLFITGIFLPFLGLFVIKLHRGNYNAFFAEAGKLAQIVLPLFTLSLLGSFGVVPRCITVAHGGMKYLSHDLSLTLFSGIFCFITFILCVKDSIMVKVVGKWMSPILICSLVVLIVTAVINVPDLRLETEAYEAFLNGFTTGYQTMDLFAAFFFSAFIFQQIQQTMPENTSTKSIVLFAVKPSILAAGLLSIVYLSFVFLGAYYADVMVGVAPEELLSAIAYHTMGNNASIFIGITVLLSCLTTAIALNGIYAKYLSDLFRFKGRAFPIFLFGTTTISFALSLLDFKGIAAFLAPALEVSYPGIIALTVLSIITRRFNLAKILVFYFITGYMAFHIFFSL